MIHYPVPNGNHVSDSFWRLWVALLIHDENQERNHVSDPFRYLWVAFLIQKGTDSGGEAGSLRFRRPFQGCFLVISVSMGRDFSHPGGNTGLWKQREAGGGGNRVDGAAGTPKSRKDKRNSWRRMAGFWIRSVVETHGPVPQMEPNSHPGAENTEQTGLVSRRSRE